MVFLDCIWLDLNAPVSYTPWCHSLLGSITKVPFFQHAGKGKCCMWIVNKMEIYFAKIGFIDCKWSNLNRPSSYTPWCLDSLLVSTLECPLYLYADAHLFTTTRLSFSDGRPLVRMEGAGEEVGGRKEGNHFAANSKNTAKNETHQVAAI